MRKSWNVTFILVDVSPVGLSETVRRKEVQGVNVPESTNPASHRIKN